jgi:hypothetical protein
VASTTPGAGAQEEAMRALMVAGTVTALTATLDEPHWSSVRRMGDTMSLAETAVAEWISRVRAEYLEMPDLTLTRWQMRRFWLLDASLCDAVVDALVASGFLWRRSDDTYARVSDCTHGGSRWTAGTGFMTSRGAPGGAPRLARSPHP